MKILCAVFEASSMAMQLLLSPPPCSSVSVPPRPSLPTAIVVPTSPLLSSSSAIASPILIGRRLCVVGAFWAVVIRPGILLASAGEEDIDELREQEDRVVHLFEEATKSVVCIKDVEVLRKTGIQDVKVEGIGSGFIWDRFGHIVTNYHVVAKLANDRSGNHQSQVVLLGLDGKSITKEAQLIGIDPAYDLAVLKINAPENMLQPVPIGLSKSLKVGQNCYAIGNPYGYEHTLTSGVVSGLGREIPSPIGKLINGAIQTDAAINAGVACDYSC
eukprot:c27603_g1_i3 orf=446-1264(-)